MSNDSFANRLQFALKSTNLKQVDLCEKTGLSSSLINKYITGKAIPRQKRIYLLAQALNVNPAWLMGFNVSSEIILENNNYNNINLSELTEEELKEVKEYINYLISKRKK